MRASSQSNLSSGEALASAGAESSGSGGGRAVIRHMSHAVADDGIEASSNNSNDDDNNKLKLFLFISYLIINNHSSLALA